jgi:hypothetical protein
VPTGGEVRWAPESAWLLWIREKYTSRRYSKKRNRGKVISDENFRDVTDCSLMEVNKHFGSM